jgi:hypothetical protein
METTIKRRSGRPKKAEEDKVQYQRIAVYAKDYLKLVEKLSRRNKGKTKKERLKLTDAFTEMVNDYCAK